MIVEGAFAGAGMARVAVSFADVIETIAGTFL